MVKKESNCQQLKKKYIQTIYLCLFLFLISVLLSIYGLKACKTPVLAVLLFHEVVPNPQKPWEITEENLENLVKDFLSQGYEFIDPNDFTNILESNLTGSKVMVTFDDGIEKSTNAIKQLYLKFGIKSVCFLLGDKIGQNEYMTKETILDLQNNYGTYFGVHGKYHKKYTEQLKEGIELGKITEETRKSLSSLLGKNIDWLSYPFGDYNQKVLEEINSHTGIKLAFTIEQGNLQKDSNKLLLKRYMYLINDSEKKVDEKILYSLLPPVEHINGQKTLGIAFLLFLFGICRIKMALEIKNQIKLLREDRT